MGSMWKSQEVGKITAHGQTLRAEAVLGSRREGTGSGLQKGCRSEKVRSWDRGLRRIPE